MGVVYVLGGFFVSRLIAPEYPGQVKNTAYECGELPLGPAWTRFNVGYYIFALLFLIFDVEAIFLFPWAIAMKTAGLTGFVEVLIFFAILGLGLLYGWKKHALKWE